MEAAVKIRKRQHNELQASSCRSLSLWSRSCFHPTSQNETPPCPPHNKKIPSNNPPHVAERVYLSSLSCFGLTHAPHRVGGLVRIRCRQMCRTAATAFNERFHASGGVPRWKVSGKQ